MMTTKACESCGGTRMVRGHSGRWLCPPCETREALMSMTPAFPGLERGNFQDVWLRQAQDVTPAERAMAITLLVLTKAQAGGLIPHVTLDWYLDRIVERRDVRSGRVSAWAWQY